MGQNQRFSKGFPRVSYSFPGFGYLFGNGKLSMFKSLGVHLGYLILYLWECNCKTEAFNNPWTTCQSQRNCYFLASHSFQLICIAFVCFWSLQIGFTPFCLWFLVVFFSVLPLVACIPCRTASSLPPWHRSLRLLKSLMRLGSV